MKRRLSILTPSAFLIIGLLATTLGRGQGLLDPFHAPRWVAMAGLSSMVCFWLAKDKTTLFHYDMALRGLVILLFPYLFFSAISLSQVYSLAEGLWALVQVFTGASLILGFFTWLSSQPIPGQRWKPIQVVRILFVLIGILHATAALAEVQGWFASPFQAGWGPAGWSGNRNLVAGFQVLVLPWAFHLALEPHLSVKGHFFAMTTATLAAGFTGYTLALCQSRASMLACLAGLIAGSLLMFFKKWQSRAKPLNLSAQTPKTWMAGILILALASGFFLQATRILPATQMTVFEKVTRITDTTLASHTSVTERLVLWKKTVALIQAHPLLGVGLGQWKITWPSQGFSGLPHQDMSLMHTRPHNDWLWVISEIGILGGLAYALLPLLGMTAALSAFFRAPTWQHAITPLCMGSGLMAYAVLATFDFPRERAEHTTAFSLLLAFSLMSSTASKSASPATILTVPKVSPFFWAFCVLNLGCAVYGLLRWQSEKQVYQLVAAHLQNEKEAVQHLFASLSPWLNEMSPSGVPLAWYAGLSSAPLGASDANQDKHSWQKAEGFFHQAVTVHPFYIHALNDRAMAQLQMQDTASAIAFLKTVQDIAPGYLKSVYPLVWLMHTQGESKLALKILDAIPESQRDANGSRLKNGILNHQGQERK